MPTEVQAPRLRELSPEQAARAAELLDEGLDLPPAERDRWLAALAQRDAELAPVVAALLRTAADAEPAETAQLVARSVARRAAEAVAGDDMPSLEGRRFGPWRVLRLLGQGGMGAVWLARRDDGLFERDVALKLVHASWFGPMLHRRFAQERRILASLEHPNIASMLDAGIAADGQPYLALEYVDGQPLDAFCDTYRATLAQRIRLMLQVLGAVQHAHQNLVIHRDLKPANILVTRAGEVRLLDFGIAKLLGDGGGGEETELTHHAGRPLTPHYAAPEQREGRTLSTPSDVYALGVVLFELLSGQRLELVGPLAPRMSRQPLTPEAAVARASTPAALARALAGDLDTIVQKALKADPAERYPTADALRQDLQRHLDGLPVLARPASAGYRLRKLVMRHRWRVGAAAGIVLLLVGAAAVSLWQARQAREALLLAQAESTRAQAVQAFLLDLFNANSLRQADPVKARQTTARELLDAGAARAGEALKDTPVAQEAVLNALADLYFQLELQDDAARLRAQRVATLERLHGEADPRVADALLDLAHDVASTHQRETGLAALSKARRIADLAPGASDELRGWIDIETARIEQYLSVGATRRDADSAVARFRARLVRWTNLFHATQMAARARYLAGDQAGAQALNQEGLALVDRYEPQTAAWRKTPWVHLAESQIEALQFDEAETNLRRAWKLALQQDGPIGSVTLQTQAKLGGLLHATGRRDEGWRLLQEALAGLDNPKARIRPDAAAAIRRFAGMAANARGDYALGLQLLDAEVADLRAHYPRPISLSRALLQQAASFTGLKRYADADAALDEALTLWLGAAADGGAAPFMANRFHLQRARTALARGDAPQLLAHLQALALPAEAAGMLVLDEVQARTLRAALALQQGEPAVADALATGALARLDETGLARHAPDLQAEAARLRDGARRQRAGQG